MRDTALSALLFVTSSAACWLIEAKRRSKRSVASSLSATQEDRQNLIPWPVQQLRFEEYPSLAPRSPVPPILGLYFAAGWCDDCQKFTPMLERLVASDAASASSLLHIVYISSDRTEQDMVAYKPSFFSHVPYDSVEERSLLKRTFRTCAKKEADEIHLPLQARKFGIPTLILLESATGKVLNLRATEEVSQMNPDTLLEEWKIRLQASSGS